MTAQRAPELTDTRRATLRMSITLLEARADTSGRALFSSALARTIAGWLRLLDRERQGSA